MVTLRVVDRKLTSPRPAHFALCSCRACVVAIMSTLALLMQILQTIIGDLVKIKEYQGNRASLLSCCNVPPRVPRCNTSNGLLELRSCTESSATAPVGYLADCEVGLEREITV